MFERTVVLKLSVPVASLLALTGLGCEGAGRASGGWFEPQGERWTILCLELHGPACARSARNVAKALETTPGIDAKEVRVVARGDRARIYYGTYYRKVEPTTRTRAPSPQLERDLMLLRELVDEQGQRYFLGARRVLAPSPEAEHPPWDLRNTEATYTLQVAVYYNDAAMRQRKRAALEKCRQLRRKGFEAYYCHGQTSSMVTVGAFGPEALLDKDGRVRHIEAGGVQRPVAHRYCDEIIALQARPECRYNLTNDNIEYNIDENGRRAPVRSLVVRVPRGEEDSWADPALSW